MTHFQTLTPSNLERDAFVAAFADIYEHSAWVAEQVYDSGVDESLDQVEVMHERMSQVLLNADRETQLNLINAHPDLAGKAALRGELTASSTSEQAGAGIQECTPDEYERFVKLNEAYKAKFGFIFIMAVTGSDRYKILASFEERMGNSQEQEFQRAVAEINKIALFRLQGM